MRINPNTTRYLPFAGISKIECDGYLGRHEVLRMVKTFDRVVEGEQHGDLFVSIPHSLALFVEQNQEKPFSAWAGHIEAHYKPKNGIPLIYRVWGKEAENLENVHKKMREHYPHDNETQVTLKTIARLYQEILKHQDKVPLIQFLLTKLSPLGERVAVWLKGRFGGEFQYEPSWLLN